MSQNMPDHSPTRQRGPGLLFLPAGRKIRPLLAAALALLLLSACSHTRPYYRPDVHGHSLPAVDSAQIVYRLALIGDAGQPRPAEAVLAVLQRWAAQLPGKTTVLFLGDNIYPQGMPPSNDPARKEMERRMSVQLQAVKESGAAALVIPGNHDWAKGGSAGLAALQREEQFVEQFLQDANSFLPDSGCPGPAYRDFPGLRLIVIDSQWWLHTPPPLDHCPAANRPEILKRLRRLLREAGNRPVVVAAHHPLRTHDSHGGFADWKDHLFPLRRVAKWLWLPTPLVGSLYPFARSHIFKSNQATYGPAYRKMIADLQEVFPEHKPLIYAAGHSHNLQVMEGGEAADYLLVSGAGSQSKLSMVSDGPETLFALLQSGFMTLTFLRDGQVYLEVIQANGRVVFALPLRQTTEP